MAPVDPTITSIIPYDKSLKVYYDAGSNDGESVFIVRFYVVDTLTNTITTYSTLTVSDSYLITGLTNGTEYVVVVEITYENAEGTQLRSFSVNTAGDFNTVPVSIPNKINDLTLVEIGYDENNARFTYTVPESSAGTVRSIEFVVFDSVSKTILDQSPQSLGVDILAGSEQEITISGLTAEHTYTASVLFIDGAGESELSDPVSWVQNTAPGVPVLSNVESLLDGIVNLTIDHVPFSTDPTVSVTVSYRQLNSEAWQDWQDMVIDSSHEQYLVNAQGESILNGSGSVTITGLTNGLPTEIKALATSSVASGYSLVATALPAQFTELGAITVKGFPGDNELRASWPITTTSSFPASGLVKFLDSADQLLGQVIVPDITSGIATFTDVDFGTTSTRQIFTATVTATDTIEDDLLSYVSYTQKELTNNTFVDEFANGNYTQAPDPVRNIHAQLNFITEQNLGTIDVSWEPAEFQSDKVELYSVSAYVEDVEGGAYIETSIVLGGITTTRLNLPLNFFNSPIFIDIVSQNSVSTNTVKYPNDDIPLYLSTWILNPVTNLSVHQTDAQPDRKVNITFDYAPQLGITFDKIEIVEIDGETQTLVHTITDLNEPENNVYSFTQTISGEPVVETKTYGVIAYGIRTSDNTNLTSDIITSSVSIALLPVISNVSFVSANEDYYYTVSFTVTNNNSNCISVMVFVLPNENENSLEHSPVHILTPINDDVDNVYSVVLPYLSDGQNGPYLISVANSMGAAYVQENFTTLS